MRWAILSVFALTNAGITAYRVAVLPIGRPSVALVGACTLVILGAFAGPVGLGADEALRSIEPHTIVLLFGTMVVAVGLGAGGFFDWVADALTGRVRSRTVLLWIVTCGSGLLSAMLLNDARLPPRHAARRPARAPDAHRPPAAALRRGHGLQRRQRADALGQPAEHARRPARWLELPRLPVGVVAPGGSRRW